MKPKNFLLMPSCLLTFCLVALFALGNAMAADPVGKVVYRFLGTSDGSRPASGLIADQAGNLYGTAEYSGAGGYYGTVFKLTPPSKPGEAWNETTLYSFGNHGDGARPAAGMIFDRAGNLYGTTSDSNAGGYGEIFELSPPATQGNPWTETVLYSFQGGNDGADPYGGLVFDEVGNLYGTTESSVFQLRPPAVSGGAWTLAVLHDFKSLTSDGWVSVAGLVRDQQGNLYGTTEWGGAYDGAYCESLGCGTVFEVSPPLTPSGAWREKVLYRFAAGQDGFIPFSALALDRAGNLYGTTYSGGTLGGGTLFQLTPPAQQNGPWTETILHNFSYGYQDGAAPQASPIFDAAGNLYGTTEFGGNDCYYNSAPYGCGVVFELARPARMSDPWAESLLYRFTTGPISPKESRASLLFDRSGNVYGTTTFGGYKTCTDDGGDGCGAVFEITGNSQ